MGWLDRIFLGTDLDAEAKRTEELRAWEDRLNSAPRMQEVWTPDAWHAHEAQLQAEQTGELAPGSYDRQVYAAAGQGAREGLDDITAGTRSAVNATVGKILPETIKTLFAFLPAWVWLAGALYLAGRAGWLTALAGILKGSGKGIAWLRTR